MVRPGNETQLYLRKRSRVLPGGPEHTELTLGRPSKGLNRLQDCADFLIIPQKGSEREDQWPPQSEWKPLL